MSKWICNQKLDTPCFLSSLDWLLWFWFRHCCSEVQKLNTKLTNRLWYIWYQAAPLSHVKQSTVTRQLLSKCLGFSASGRSLVLAGITGGPGTPGNYSMRPLCSVLYQQIYKVRKKMSSTFPGCSSRTIAASWIFIQLVLLERGS